MKSRVGIAVGLCLIVVACGGSGGGGGEGSVTQVAPASVAGVWEMVSQNPGEATLRDCTGDLSIFEGLTIAGIASGGPTCVYSDNPTITQSGSSFTVNPIQYQCSDGTAGSLGGGGSVSGSSLSGQLDTLSDQNWVASEKYSGTVNGSTIALKENKITYNGSIVGSCTIQPNLRIAVTIHSSKSTSTGLPSRLVWTATIARGLDRRTP